VDQAVAHETLAPVSGRSPGRFARALALSEKPPSFLVGPSLSLDPPAPPVPKLFTWTGWILSALPVAILLLSAAMKLVRPPSVVRGFEHFGYPAGVVVGIGVAELACTALYLIPRTAVLGAILLTGYLGGATATCLRVGDAYAMPVVCGVLVWAGLSLRERRLRELLPLRRGP